MLQCKFLRKQIPCVPVCVHIFHIACLCAWNSEAKTGFVQATHTHYTSLWLAIFAWNTKRNWDFVSEVNSIYAKQQQQQLVPLCRAWNIKYTYRRWLYFYRIHHRNNYIVDKSCAYRKNDERNLKYFHISTIYCMYYMIYILHTLLLQSIVSNLHIAIDCSYLISYYLC